VYVGQPQLAIAVDEKWIRLHEAPSENPPKTISLPVLMKETKRTRIPYT